MAMSNAERQRRYRERAFKDPDGPMKVRVSLALDLHAACALKRLSNGYGVTQQEMLKRLLIEAEQAALDRLDHSQHGPYLDGQLPSGTLRGNT